jgi:homoserine O-acetyltransferase
VLNSSGMARAKTTDANHMIYMSKANQLYRLSEAEVKGIKAKILFVPASSDVIFPPELSKRALERFRAQGGRADLFVIEGDGGHLDGVFAIAKAADAIKRFVESD